MSCFGFGGTAYRNPDGIVLGTSGAASILAPEIADGSRASLGWQVELSQRQLYGVAGLKIDGAAVAARRGTWGAVAAAAQLATPVGTETVVQIEPFHARSGSFALSAGVMMDRLAVTGAPAAHLVTASATMAVRVADGLAVGYYAGGIRLAGEAYPGADIAVYAVVFGASRLSVFARVDVSRAGAATCGFASRVRLGTRVSAAFGYSGTSGGISGALTCALGRLGVSAGAELHPVLGVSESISVVFRGRGS